MDERDKIALEVMKIFLSHQGSRTLSIFSRIAIKLNLTGWVETFNYGFKDVAEKSYEMADAMIKAK